MSATLLSKAVERALRRGTGATRIEEVELVQPVWGGHGEVLRAKLAGGSVEVVIVKRITLPAGAKKKKKRDAATQRTLASYDNELTFYQQYAERLGPSVRTPHFFAGQRLEDGWVFVLEDLLESGFSMARKVHTAEDIQGALRWLAGFHAAFLGDPGKGLWKAGSYWNLADRSDEQGRMTHAKLKAAARSLDHALNHCKHKTLIHGDTKTDNFCFSDSTPGTVAGLDFQHTGLGCGMKDVMCLLDSCLGSLELEVQAEKHLELYFETLRAELRQRGPSLGADPIDADAVEKEWRKLYPVAWADYYRFLDGWAPGKYPPEGYVEQMLRQALEYTHPE